MSDYKLGDVVQYLDSHPDLVSKFNSRRAEIIYVGTVDYKIKMLDDGKIYDASGSFWKPRNETVMNRNGANS